MSVSSETIRTAGIGIADLFYSHWLQAEREGPSYSTTEGQQKATNAEY
jgi:hypothetical protein